MNRSLTIWLGAMVVVAATACGSGSEADTPAAQVDTTNSDDLDGMSSQQVEARVEALTPEQAAARGIAVDTTIHLGAPAAPDSPRAGATTPSVPATSTDSAAVP